MKLLFVPTRNHGTRASWLARKAAIQAERNLGDPGIRLQLFLQSASMLALFDLGIDSLSCALAISLEG